MTTRMGLTVLRFVLALVTGGYGLALAIAQLQGSKHHGFIALGLAEFAAAILLLIPKTMRIGGIALIAVLSAAALFHLLHGDYSVGYLAVYGAAALAVVSTRTPV